MMRMGRAGRHVIDFAAKWIGRGANRRKSLVGKVNHQP